MGNWRGHLKTITAHKLRVMHLCFRVGLYRQGLLHDLSKYSPTEFLVGARYYQGDRSPNEAERLEKGYSAAWLHHKGRNRHHYEYWTDYNPQTKRIEPVKMPRKFVAEMFCDRVAASKTYQGAAYTQRHPWEYYDRSRDHYLLHPETRKLLETLLIILRDQGETAAFTYIRQEVLGHGK